jgi:hypothetical protein
LGILLDFAAESYLVVTASNKLASFAFDCELDVYLLAEFIGFVKL